MAKQNLIRTKSYQFALDAIRLYKSLQNQEFIISKQFVRSATSVGANIEEAIGGHSRSDFYWKVSIAYKEARESAYWLRLLRDTNYLDATKAGIYITRAEELVRILASIQKSLRESNS